ncbi:P-loop containing nucleoside triphosphate hydrolase protein [Xylariaceae sp. AK1471]|nr:P-loop containing nucleoside triphosphate hydrolase protein [Xylariaceae sp. AK1471]
MEQPHPTPGGNEGLGPWIKYRVEHRNRYTNELISSRDTNGPGLDDDADNADGPRSPAFALITTYRTGLSLSQNDSRLPLTRATIAAALPPTYAMHLYSPAIIHALQSVVKYYPSQDLTGDIVIKWPYPILVHHYEELAKFRDEVAQKDQEDLCVKEKGTCEDIDLLLQFLDHSIMPGVLEEKDRNAKGFYSFQYAWVSHKPGVTVLASRRESTDWVPQVIHSVTGGVFVDPATDWQIHFWNMTYDGTYLGRCLSSDFLEKFDGLMPYESNIIVEDVEQDDLPEPVAEQLQYGKSYWELTQKQCRHYKGKTQEFPYNQVDGLVMADIEAFYAGGGLKPTLMDSKDCRHWIPDCNCRVCRIKGTKGQPEKTIVSLFEDYNDITMELVDELTPHQYFMCSFETRAFVFKTRMWEKLHVRGFSEPKFDEDMINHLVMDPQRKQMLKSLAKSFARINKNGEKLPQAPWTADFVQGKGHGLIFLLHGRPGVGKTYTAECIAGFTHRPLMVLTASDIGTDPARVEYQLTRNFKMAKSWNALLLIDEADVFMERRSTNDLARNSLVAGFLRALEFYDGILFLTTNRIGSFDDAFTSRVHVQLYYPNLTDEQRNEIWKTFINKLANERGDYIRLNIDAKDYIRGKEIRALEWNGREIRNAFQTAVSLAEYDDEKGEDGKVVITDEHLRAVVELSRDFKKYLGELHQANEAKRAERRYERLDSYDN